MASRSVIHQVGWARIWAFVKHPKTPLLPKAFAVLAVVYLVWPADLLPDIVPFLGWLDDLGIVSLALVYLRYCASKDLPPLAR